MVHYMTSIYDRLFVFVKYYKKETNKWKRTILFSKPKNSPNKNLKIDKNYLVLENI